MMYKTLNNIGPESLTKLFHCKNETTKYNLRNISGSLCLPQPRTNSMKNSFMYDGAKLWNSISKEIRESKSLSCFQNKIATINYCNLLPIFLLFVNKLTILVHTIL